MKKLGILFIFSMTLGFYFANSSHAQNRNDKHSSKIQGKWLDELELDAGQREKLRRLWQKKRVMVDDLRTELRAKRLELKKIMSGEGSADRARVLHARIQSIQQDLGNIDLESMLAIRELLTIEQRVKFGEIMDQRGKFGDPKPPDRRTP